MSNELHRTLVDVSEFLDEQGLQFALIGGIAAGVHGEPRFTADVVCVVAADIDRALEIIPALATSKFRPLFSDVAAVVQKAFILPIRHIETHVRVDLALGQTGFELQLIERARPILIAGRSIPVAAPEDLILMKVLAGRPRDMDDVSGIVERQRDSLDWNYLMQTADALQQAVAQDIVSPLHKLKPT